MEDEIDDATPVQIEPDEEYGFGSYVAGKQVSRERKEEIIEWFFELYPDVDYALMGDEIIIKDTECRVHFKMVWG